MTNNMNECIRAVYTNLLSPYSYLAAQGWMADRVRSAANAYYSMWDDEMFIGRYYVPGPTAVARIKARIFSWWDS